MQIKLKIRNFKLWFEKQKIKWPTLQHKILNHKNNVKGSL